MSVEAAKDKDKLVAQQPLDLAELTCQERQELALKYIREHGYISHKTYQQLTGVSETTATRDLKQLMANGAIRQTGRGPSRRYLI